MSPQQQAAMAAAAGGNQPQQQMQQPGMQQVNLAVSDFGIYSLCL